MGFVTAALCGLVVGQQTPAPQKIWQGFGVNIHFTQPAKGEIELLQAAGMAYVRTDFAWETTEKVRGKYDFSDYDKLFARLKAAHIRPYFTLDYGNELYEKGAPKSDKAVDAFAAWAAAAVNHFKGEEIVWEIWNEPNVDQFWRPKANPEAYTKLAVKTAKAMRNVDVTCRIVAPAASTFDIGFFRKAMTPELFGLIDGVSVHPYRSSGPETVYRDYIHLRELIQQIAPPGRDNLPIICSEWGYSTYKGGQVNEDRQAMYVAKLWLLSAASGCPVSIYYDWKDDGIIATNKEHHYGLVKTNLSPKPSFDAARFVIRAFAGCTVIKRMQKRDPLDWVIIGAGDGKLVRATWYQKVGGLPKFEAYDMADASNKALYNKILEEGKADSEKSVTPPKTEQKSESKNPSKTEPKVVATTKSEPKSVGPLAKTPLKIAFAPPLDEEGWCAVITKPDGVPTTKVEFRYERKDSGAKVTCFATASAPRTVESLDDTDMATTITALVNGQRVGDYSVQKMDLNPAQMELKVYKGQNTEKLAVSLGDKSSGVPYTFTRDVQSCGITPTQELEIPAAAKRFVIWIKPDGSNNNLFARIKDESGEVFQIPVCVLDQSTDRNGWRPLVIPLSELPATTTPTGKTPQGKLRWDHLLYIEAGDKDHPKSGKIEFGPAAYEL